MEYDHRLTSIYVNEDGERCIAQRPPANTVQARSLRASRRSVCQRGRACGGYPCPCTARSVTSTLPANVI